MADEARVADLLEEFREKSEPLGVIVGRVATEDLAAEALAAWVLSLGAVEVRMAADLMQHASLLQSEIERAGLRVQPAAAPTETRDSPVGLSLGRLAIAETGSVLLSEPSLEDRSVGMLSLTQAIVCPTDALVASLDDAVPMMRRLATSTGGAFSTLVTGPSRTADIERVLTVGVQGPGVVMTLFVDSLDAEPWE